MIEPRQVRLVAARDLRGFQRAVAASALRADPWSTRATAVILPSRAAAAEFELTLENLLLAGGSTRATIVLPAFLTRTEWYQAMHRAVGAGSRMLSSLERQVLMEKAARDAVAGGACPPFRLRPGLVIEMLAFYDALVRQGRTVGSFERLVLDDLLPRVEMDRGAARLLEQTRFLAAAFRAFEGHVQATSRLDEHLLRQRLLSGDARSPFSRVVVTVGDRAAEPAGLWRADFDLLVRLTGLDSVHIVATEATLASGLLERLRDELPGLEETREPEWESAGPPSTLLAPPEESRSGERRPGRVDRLYWTARDREDELADVARRIKVAAPREPERVAVVFGRRLPYVYLAQAVFDAAGIERQLLAALPLAAEPYAAAVDLVMEFASSGFKLSDGLALVRSPHFGFASEAGGDVTARGAESLSRAFEESDLEGDQATACAALAAGEDLPEPIRARLDAAERTEATLAAAAVAVAAGELRSLTVSLPASRQVETLLGFLLSRGRPSSEADFASERTLRCRAAILGGLRELADAYREHFDPPTTIAGLAPVVRRWMEAETFVPPGGRAGVHLVDSVSARYGDFDSIHIVGLVEGEWPPREGRNIFYPQFLLGDLGWPADRHRTEASRAFFFDLLGLAPLVSLSTFALEDDAIVEPSALLESLGTAGLVVQRGPECWRVRISGDEAISTSPLRRDALGGPAAAWAALRDGRTDRSAASFHGYALPAPRTSYAVREVEEYVKCPFRYFAQHVLKLPEPAGERASAARSRGVFLHEVLRDFYDGWQRSGRGSFTVESLADARAQFKALVEARLPSAPSRDRPSLEVRMLGSPARPGVLEHLARIEIERGVPVVERLLEVRFEGECEFCSDRGSRSLRVKGVADRIDLLEDGTFDLFDYKLGRAPNIRHTVQLPVYAIQAQTQLAGRRGRNWRLREAAYVPFGGSDRLVTLGVAGRGVGPALAAGQQRFLSAVEGIEAGKFPPRPADDAYCAACAFAGVCRKDYVGGN
ncbi:MAG: PD-(D/E)XK nuclease family protein [Vicinamibacterales bacterium]